MTRILALLLSIILIESCERVEFEEETTGTSQSTLSLSTLKVFCRNNNIDNASAINGTKFFAYAFEKESGKLYSTIQASFNSESDASFQLSKGDYNIVATNIDASSQKSLSQDMMLSVNDDSLVKDEYVYYGQNDVYVDGKNEKSLNINISPLTNSLNVSVKGLPEEIHKATLLLYPVFSSLNMKGDFSENNLLTIPLTKKVGDTWENEQPVRIINGSLGNYAINLNTEYSNGSVITYSSNISATFKGGENNEIAILVLSDGTIKGTIKSSMDGGNVNEEFDFGESTDDDLSDISSQDVFMIDAIPHPSESWNNHIVAFVQNSDGDLLDYQDINRINNERDSNNPFTLILISRDEYSEVTAATFTGTNPNNALELAAKYKEDDLTNWRMPTRIEAAQLRETYNEGTNLKILNETILKQNGTEITVIENDNYVRYLCEDATYSFAFRKGSQISAAGKTLSSYRLRLLNIVKARLKRN